MPCLHDLWDRADRLNPWEANSFQLYYQNSLFLPFVGSLKQVKITQSLWCGIGYSKPYALRHLSLNQMCLPIPPIPHIVSPLFIQPTATGSEYEDYERSHLPTKPERKQRKTQAHALSFSIIKHGLHALAKSPSALPQFPHPQSCLIVWCAPLSYFHGDMRPCSLSLIMG